VEPRIMSSAGIEERRLTPRRRLARLATIHLGKGGEPRYCTVTDISDGGVQIHVNGFVVPDDFALHFPGDGPAKSGNYMVVWRKDSNIGAKFVEFAER
jgi:hypothetical protein